MPSNNAFDHAHHPIGADTLNPLLLRLLQIAQVDVIRQWSPFTHPRIDALSAVVAGQ